ncbi:MAG: SDR family oxidoreductase [Verrucomicrobiota bacterium]
MSGKRVVFAGCGFLGEAAAGLFFEKGWRVLGLCATRETASRLASRPFEVRVLDISKPFEAPADWRNPDVLIHCASSGGGDASAYRAVYLDGLSNAISAFAPKRVIFTGSTSVYDQQDGGWVDENSPTEPQRETGKILLEAEAVALDAGGCVARLGGIYGPGRSMFLKKIREGNAVLEEGGGRHVNLIHRDDAARALLCLADSQMPTGIYNVVDDSPSAQRVLYGWIADFFNSPLPPEGPLDPNRRRGLNDKRVSNKKLRQLGWSPKFASFRDALPEIVEGHDSNAG